MRTIKLKTALLADGWATNVVLTISDSGFITDVQSDSDSPADEDYDLIGLPGMPNVHSHAFQRAFAGSTEYRLENRDSFWTWREKMFEFAQTLRPEHVYEIALSLYKEMISAGYTWVGEFHYLHDENPVSMGGRVAGNGESDGRAMCAALIHAADEAGIGLCLIPTLYQRGGFDDRRLVSGQSRFSMQVDNWMRLVMELASQVESDKAHLANRQIGMAMHSLRAVNDAVGVDAIGHIKREWPEMPIHIHVAEQQAEVDDCLREHGRRPIEHLFDCYDIDETWCLIHCTQSNDEELSAIARSGAVVGLCPTTEANLGDGLFAGREFLERAGRIAIGSDSHCSIDVREELRWLEYSQRYRTRERAVMCRGTRSVGRTLYELCAVNGGRALGVKTGQLAVGYRADLVLVRGSECNDSKGENADDVALDRYLFCNHPGSQGPERVMIGGRWRKA